MSQQQTSHSTPASGKRGVNRRSLVKGALWSAPVVATAATVPAYAASTDVPETPTLQFGVFTQAFNSNPSNDFNTRYGLDSYTVQVPNVTATSTSPQSAGGGTFTPGGSVGAGLYGGAGLWISAPINSKGEFQGSTYLYGSAHLQVTFEFTFPTAEDVTAPLLWDTDNDAEVAALAKSEGGAKTNNPAVSAFNGVAYAAKFYEPVIEGNTWTGVLDIRTSDFLTATANGPVRYAQVLASQVPVYFTEVTSSYTLTTTVQLTSGTVAMQLTDDGEYTYRDLAGASASATITR